MSRYQRGHIYEALGARFMFSPPARCAGLTSCWSQMGKVGDKGNLSRTGSGRRQQSTRGRYPEQKEYRTGVPSIV
jgi:hypothetical protein